MIHQLQLPKSLLASRLPRRRQTIVRCRVLRCHRQVGSGWMIPWHRRSASTTACTPLPGIYLLSAQPHPSHRPIISSNRAVRHLQTLITAVLQVYSLVGSGESIPRDELIMSITIQALPAGIDLLPTAVHLHRCRVLEPIQVD